MKLLTFIIALSLTPVALAKDCKEVFDDFAASKRPTDMPNLVPLPDGGVIAVLEGVDGEVRLLAISSPEFHEQMKFKEQFKVRDSGTCTMPGGETWRYTSLSTKKYSKKPDSKSEERQLPHPER